MTTNPTSPGPGLREAPPAGEWPDASSVVSLDRWRRSAPASVGGRPAADAPLRVLVVEDEEGDFHMIRELLARAEGTGFVAERAATVEAGLARLVAGGFDVCLCDHHLGEGDGLDLVRAAHARGCRTPVILTSGFADPDLEREALDSGVADLIDKEEFDTQRLDRAIRLASARQRHLDRREAAAVAVEDRGAAPAGDPDPEGLVDRALFGDRLERALASARRRRAAVAVVVVDLDRRWPVSGKPDGASDEASGGAEALLPAVGRRLRACLRETDTVARLGIGGGGGDDGLLAVVVDGLDRAEDATLVAGKLLEALQAPLILDGGREVAVAAGVGAALFPQDGADAARLLRRARTAAGRARRAGAGAGVAVRFHDEDLDARAREAVPRAAELRRAIEAGGDDDAREDGLRLHFQPQATLRVAELGLASMAQWHRPGHDPVAGERLRRLAEEAGLLEPLTDWMLAAACRQARRWRATGLRRLHVAVPLLSRRQLGWSRLPERLDALLRAEGLPPDRLELEIDERPLLEELGAGGGALGPLRELGVRLALAGFGGGAASLTALREVPLATLKLSRVLLHDTPGDDRRTLFAGAVVALARQIGVRVVAEGVESGAQLRMLKLQGCDAVQSLTGCPALPAEACTDWLRQAAARA